MSTRPTSATRLWRHMPLVILCHAILYLCAAQALAQVPEAVINRIVELRVEREQVLRQKAYHQIDDQTSTDRMLAISREIMPLEGQIYQLPFDKQGPFLRRLYALTNARLAAILPDWHPPAEQSRQQQAAGENGGESPDAGQHHVPRHPPVPGATQQLGPPSGAGMNWASWLHQYIPAEFLRALVALGMIGAFYAIRRRLRKKSKEPAARASIWWYAPALLLLWMWMVPVQYLPGWGNKSEFYIEALVNRGLFILCTFGFFALLPRLFRKREPATPPGHSTVYGTAQYAAQQNDIADEACLANGLFLGKSSRPRQRGASLDALDAPGAPVCSTPEHHRLIVARTRTGKGTRVIVPTLLRYGGSALVIDPKGENAAITAAVRANHLNQDVYLLNPWNELAETWRRRSMGFATYNPLDILYRDDPNAVAIAQTLAGAICPIGADFKNKFWEGTAAGLLAAVFLWLADQATEPKTLARAREIISLSRSEFEKKYLTRMAVSDGFSGAIRELTAQFIDLAPETYSGIMSNLSENTKFLSDPQIKAATATSSFPMENLARKKATVYVVIPTDRMATQKTWLRLVIASAMHVFKHPRVKMPAGHRCLFLIDEFPALGRLDDIPSDIASMSGFGVDFALIVQGLDQLEDHYGKAKNTILSNCAYKWFCNITDFASAKEISEILGKATVGTTSTSDTFSSGSNRSSQGRTTTRSETGRSLLTPDEIVKLGPDVAIALPSLGDPHYLRPVD